MQIRPNDTSAVIITYSAAADSRKRAASVLSIATPPLTSPTPPLTGTNPRNAGPCWPACLPGDRRSSGHSCTRGTAAQEFIFIWCHEAWHHGQTAWYSNCASLPLQNCDTTTVPRNSATQRFNVIEWYCSSEIDDSARGKKKFVNIFI